MSKHTHTHRQFWLSGWQSTVVSNYKQMWISKSLEVSESNLLHACTEPACKRQKMEGRSVETYLDIPLDQCCGTAVWHKGPSNPAATHKWKKTRHMYKCVTCKNRSVQAFKLKTASGHTPSHLNTYTFAPVCNICLHSTKPTNMRQVWNCLGTEITWLGLASACDTYTSKGISPCAIALIASFRYMYVEDTLQS